MQLTTIGNSKYFFRNEWLNDELVYKHLRKIYGFVCNRPEHRNPDISVQDPPYPDWAFPGRDLEPIFVLTTSGNLPRTSRLKCGTRSRRRQRGRGEKSRKSLRNENCIWKTDSLKTYLFSNLTLRQHQCSCLKRGTVKRVYNDHRALGIPQKCPFGQIWSLFRGCSLNISILVVWGSGLKT